MRTYRRCGCTEVVAGKRRQLGAGCPRLTAPGHGTWAFAVRIPPAIDPRRLGLPPRKGRAFVRSGYATREAAEQAAREALAAAAQKLTNREAPPRHEPKRLTVDGKRVPARRAGDLVEAGECTPVCLLAAEEVCACRCDGRFHGALADAPAYPLFVGPYPPHLIT